MTIPTIEERILRYQSWLCRENRDRPLIGLIWEPDIPPLPAMLDRVGLGNEVHPEDVDPQMFLPFVEQCYQQERTLNSETIQPFSPAFGIPWMEAMSGCIPVAYEGSIWAQPWLNDYQHRPAFFFNPDHAWFQSMLSFTRALVTAAEGRFPVALPQMRGPLDVLAAMRTPEQICIDMVEQPDAVREVVAELTDQWIGTAKALLEVIPPFYGGYSSRMKMWAPGETVTPQNDVSSLISPKMYQAFFEESDRAIFSAFPYTCFHMHSTEHRQVDGLLRQEQLTCIEFSLEHNVGGLPLEPSKAVARKIQSVKPLILAAPDPASASECRQDLPSEGLCLLLWTNEAIIPDSHRAWLEEQR
jgi:hypothetical protein